MTNGRLAVIAGSGDLPKRIVEHAAAMNRRPFVFGLTGYAHPELMARADAVEIALGEFGRLMRLMRELGCDEVVFVGALKRPDIRTLKFDIAGVQAMPRLLAAAGKGDDALLRAVMETFAEAGFTVVGADDVLADLLAPAGRIGALAPSTRDWVDIRRAAAAATSLGALDVGQGAVSCDDSVVALEDQDGTDAMLVRVAGMPKATQGTLDSRRGVLVKRPKPQQERRIDLPTIGVTTIHGAADAGLAGVAVEAGGALIVDRVEVANAADRLGLFVYGFDADEIE